MDVVPEQLDRYVFRGPEGARMPGGAVTLSSGEWGVMREATNALVKLALGEPGPTPAGLIQIARDAHAVVTRHAGAALENIGDRLAEMQREAAEAGL